MLAAALRQVSPPRPHASELETAMRLGCDMMPDDSGALSPWGNEGLCGSESGSGSDVSRGSRGMRGGRRRRQPHPLYGLENFKTELCMSYMLGECRQGQICQFAHGSEELRSSPMAKASWKTDCTGGGGSGGGTGPVRLSLAQMLDDRAALAELDGIMKGGQGLALPALAGLFPPTKENSAQKCQYLATPAPGTPAGVIQMPASPVERQVESALHVPMGGLGSLPPHRLVLSDHIAGEDPSAVKEDFLATPLPFVGAVM